MNLSKQNMRGFTLIELMVTLAVLAIILTMAIPSFNEFRQRSALRGASDQFISFWANSRMEALKNNSLVKVSMSTSGNNFCLGAATTIDPADTAKCDCFETVTTDTDYCAIGRYPADQAEWKRIRFLDDSDLTIGASDNGVVIIDPKRGGLSNTGMAGYWQIASPTGGVDYRLRVNVDLFGRAVACEPASSPSKMPQFSGRRCN